MFLQKIKNSIVRNAKNVVGWRTKQKIVVISVDDYGNVRLDSKKARAKLDQEGVPVYNRFDAFDTLETKQDLEMLFEVLQSVRDATGRHAVFSVFAVPCNIDFERVAETGYKQYHYELLPQTYQKLSQSNPEKYQGAWALWKQGMREGLIVPQFHGREHLNLEIFERRLEANDQKLITCLKNRSYTSIARQNGEVSPMAAFDFWEFEENERLQKILVDGLNKFESVFGYRARNFAPPVYHVHPVLFETLVQNGVKFIDGALITNEHQGKGKYKKKYSYTGRKVADSLYQIVRNVVFEPTDDRSLDWPSHAMKQIEAAFRWNRPAIISSHRVNYCGHIDKDNRKKGLSDLEELLKRITARWSEVKFMTINELGELMITSQN